MILMTMLITTTVYAEDIPYTVGRDSVVKMTDCAYNGNVYVMVGTKGYIGVSDDLTKWNEVSNVCYTDIENIIWDGKEFVFISNFNVYKSSDGYNWSKQASDVIAGKEFQYIDGKYLVRQADDDKTNSVVTARVGFTSDFKNFEEIDFSQAENMSELHYTFTPDFYYINGFYFVQGLIPDIVYSTDLKTWNILPELPNKNNSDKKRLLFTNIGDSYVIYYEENDSVVAYSISLDNISEWTKHTTNLPNTISDRTMQKTHEGIFCFSSFYDAYYSNDGFTFEKIDFRCVNPVVNEYIPLSVYQNNSHALVNLNETRICDKIQDVPPSEQKPIWTGKEYIKYDSTVLQSSDAVNYSQSNILSENYLSIYQKGATTIKYTGKFYMARVGGYEDPKGRGGALENGRTLFLLDNEWNVVKTYLFDGDVCDMAYCGNRYYVKIGDLINKDKYTILSSDDMENWVVENDMTEVPISNSKSVLLPEYDRQTSSNISYTSRDTIENIKLMNGQWGFVPVNYETKTDNNVYIINEIYAAKMMLPDGVFIGFSNDGVYYTKVRISDDFIKLSERSTNNKDDIFYSANESIVYSEYGFNLTFNMNDIQTALQHGETAYVEVNGEILGFDTMPVIENDRTLVPLRFIFETLGAEVDWIADTNTALVNDEDTTIMFSIDNTTAVVNDVSKVMDVPARLINDKTLVPLRFLSEELGFDVEWNEETRTASISK